MSSNVNSPRMSRRRTLNWKGQIFHLQPRSWPRLTREMSTRPATRPRWPFTRDIAARMGLSPDDQRLSYLCGLVHDIGKIGLPPGLLKPGALTLEERRQMQLHSEIGERILSSGIVTPKSQRSFGTTARGFHGEGYPDGLTQEDTPLISRIISVADAYNAMTSNRPYLTRCHAVWPACV